MDKLGKVYLTTTETVKIGAFTFLIILYFFVLASIINSGISREVKIGMLSNVIYANRFILSESCLGHNDGARQNLGVIESEKITSERLDSCLKNDAFSAKINVTYSNVSKIAYNNQPSYIVNSKLCFSERFSCNPQSPKHIIAVYDKGIIHPGTIEMSVVFDEA